jgi:hypothetical protein
MEILQFTLDNLKDLDGGKAVLAFQTHIVRAANDCLDRPAEPKARTVVLQVELIPVMEPGGDCTEVSLSIQAKSTVPTHKTKAYSMGLRRNGVLVFAPDSPDHIDQTTLDFRNREDE